MAAVARGPWTPADIRAGMFLYAVTDSAWLHGRTLAACVQQAIDGGATFVQLREKHMTTDELVAEAATILPICRAAHVPFLIDDDVEAARRSGADGVHVGQSDTACAEARRVLGPDAIIGVSAQTVEQARAAEAAGADYLGVGALIPTPTKPDAVDVTRDELAAICAAVDIPVVGIGGLHADTLDVLDGTGVAGAAVVSAIFAADDITAATRELADKLTSLNLAPSCRFTVPAVLSIAGSDSSGGAGIQADIKAIAANGLFAETAITALTAQNTCGVRDVLEATPAFVAAQIDAVFEDIPPAAVKIGMVSSSAIIEAIAERLEKWKAANIVVDPVMVATSGARLISDDASEALTGKLLPLARVITPNIPEAEALTGRTIDSEEAQAAAATELAHRFGCAALVKGGHGVADANDVLAEPAADGDAEPRLTWFRHERIDTDNTHGTGCTLSSAIACGLARGLDVPQAVEQAKAYLTGALAAGLDLGHGSGPVDHMWQHRG
ncbi:bifunctional hydroxymethylpyrimidine kinase/phosphomethylpyrimidine kinase [Collinsella tanakaei]|uniref:bifunctional hydroxymethylpyrimidine kinase/phosphomethylpyrimidine kinase n=1 Tax=Collinsella tanakaei TaxID=626935 RepID=UPI0025A37BA2|nr:bifunctional hydroxymethylpyrimidine kinase/phosphomethylpyrimidine kinase [Collinsella tanakaei]MDM8301443.1 bifunctional hydroxymethylpyrimidine kinase/phosphomethylpyrimidine kinase [Collinsella tanakaei]